jgi:hypothetical protein
MADVTTSEGDRPGADGSHSLQRYGIWAAKGSLCVLCWVGLWVTLVMYGPPAVSVPLSPGLPSPTGVVPAVFGILLAAGFATILTIVLGVFVLASIGWNRDRGAGDEDQTTPNASDALEEGS